MAVGTRDWLCFPNASEYDTNVDAVESSDPEVVQATVGAGCAVVEALAEGSVTVSIDTSRGHVDVAVEAVTADSFVLREGADGSGAVLGPGPTRAFSVGDQWVGVVEWRSGEHALRGLVDSGFSVSAPSVAALDIRVLYPDTYGINLGSVRVNLTFGAPGTTQLMWNDVPGPILIVE